MAKTKKEYTPYVVQDKNEKNFDLAIQDVLKKFGKESVRLMDSTDIADVDVIPTGSYLIDYALGIGGVPRGRIVEVLGTTMGGKTTFTLSCIAQAQKHGLKCAFIDAENALTASLVQGVGVNMSELLISQPDTGEEGLEILLMLVASNQFALIVVDSVAALVPKAEIMGEMGDSHMGLQARMMGQAMRKLTAIISKTGTCVIFINQIREKIGVMFGSPETTPGGNALKFFSSIRVDLRRIGAIKNGEDNIGNKVKVTIVKNKLAPPFRMVETEIYFGKGFSRGSELLELAIQKGLVTKSGSWFNYGEARMGQGKAEAIKYLRANKSVVSVLERKLGLTKPGKDSTTPKAQETPKKKKVKE